MPCFYFVKGISRDRDRLIVKSSTSPDNSKTTLISSSTAYPTSYPHPILQKCLAGIVKIVLNVRLNNVNISLYYVISFACCKFCVLYKAYCLSTRITV